MFELMIHPDLLAPTARRLENHGDLVVVVEHVGWPRNDSDEERALWTDGINALAGLGHNVVCKLSGLAMPLRSMAAGVLAPWLEHAIDAFGMDRCLFASNFPVDGLHGTFDELYSTYSAVTAGLSDETPTNSSPPTRSGSTAASGPRGHELLATITGPRADCTTWDPTDPSSIPANPPRPWLPTTSSCAAAASSSSRRAGWSRRTTRRTLTSG